MITIPLEGYTPQENEELKTICMALFIEVEDNRLMSVMSDSEVDSYVKLLMNSKVCENLYGMVGIFGAKDFITFIRPLIALLASSGYSKDTYIPLIRDKIKELT